ncbi:alanine racemase [Nocardioides sp. zg-536]|uniref:Alanine racemase n=1 Tax=Nocardioides faecalis TaxID=2803858 RepID=A0A938Y0L3_9ACTN|nr:alanine racemase [Nocardioides faecalis]MBM9459962.1 alanine racemase [Nocardioides faecalis]MBS4753168.1 alanine racemase [Nocardioides faecalis]QVI58814.1 alanine racemase [Nocardioides faecalis]
MSLTLRVDGPRWRAHLESVAEATPGLVPVAKGNGYGFTNARLARRAQWLAERGHDVRTLAVGTYLELPDVAQRWSGDLLVLTPWRPWVPLPEPEVARRLVHTVSRAEDLRLLLDADPRARVVLERMTSMRRHGMSARELWEAGDVLRRHPGARVEGLALHLPLGQGNHLGEVSRLVNDYVAADIAGHHPPAVWVSHLSREELDTLRSQYGDFTFRPRSGTGLWLGDRGALRVTATVLDVHPVERGDAFGYRGRTAPKSGHVLVVSGGTAHGIGLEAPTGEQSIKARATTLAKGGLDAVGFVRSPYAIDGKQRLFAEPPHMQASMLFLPAGSRVPEVGEDVDVRVRFTTTAFDRVVFSD